jgi:hypothetical protein
MHLHCAQEAASKHHSFWGFIDWVGDGIAGSSEDQKDACLYVQIVQDNPAAQFTPEKDLETFADLSISLTRRNCSVFLSRVAANRLGLDFWHSLSDNIGNAASGASAFASPVASAAISTSNIVISNSTKSFDDTYFASQAFDAFQAAVWTSMNSQEQMIRGRLDDNRIAKASQHGQVPYSGGALAADLDAYGRLCSIQAGLEQLAKIAKDNQRQSNKDLILSSGGRTMEQKLRELSGSEHR